MAASMEWDTKVTDSGEQPPLSGSYPSVVERYYTTRYKIDVNGKSCEDFCVLKHSNKVCLVTIAKGHPLLRENKQIQKVDFQVGASTNRMKNKVIGKRKKGGQWLNQTAELCKVTCSDSTCYTMYSCISAKLIEVNETLLENPQLIQTKPCGEGYIAIVLPKLGGCDLQMDKLLTPAQYEVVLKARLDKARDGEITTGTVEVQSSGGD
ncbi:protein Simiate-like [Acanthaster planci]|uniref:Protein Abitram n=1 Tax=Acanthaster planci TaxID=133434 RepID=A0A8B7Y3F9_ACAPL|nr:protein Simiate-like [Acanthaster planci]XP_022087718.1 protein Simiate-like [Acanthaster planci]